MDTAIWIVSGFFGGMAIGQGKYYAGIALIFISVSFGVKVV